MDDDKIYGQKKSIFVNLSTDFFSETVVTFYCCCCFCFCYNNKLVFRFECAQTHAHTRI